MRSAVDKVVREQCMRLTQEHQLTSRIAQSLEQTLNGSSFMDHEVRVIVQEMPDKGPRSLEKQIGADLYIGIKFSGPESEIAKGLFVQSKWDQAMPKSELEALHEQCEKLVWRSAKGSFVWLYGEDGTRVISADEVLAHPSQQPQTLSSNNVKELMSGVFDCTSGDRELIMEGIFDDPERLAGMLLEFRTKRGVAITLRKRKPRRVRRR